MHQLLSHWPELNHKAHRATKEAKKHILNMNNHMNTAKNQGKPSGRMDIEGEEIESTRVFSCLLILLIMLTCSLSYNF